MTPRRVIGMAFGVSVSKQSAAAISGEMGEFMLAGQKQHCPGRDTRGWQMKLIEIRCEHQAREKIRRCVP